MEPPAVSVKFKVLCEAVTVGFPEPEVELTFNVAVIGIVFVDAPVRTSEKEQVVFCVRVFEATLTVMVPLAGPLVGETWTHAQFAVDGTTAV